jgi:6-phosphogluconolactonase/glucosamine-6-phosphate isomerase/deaminase
MASPYRCIIHHYLDCYSHLGNGHGKEVDTQMTDKVVSIHKSKFEEYKDLLESINPTHVMVLAVGEDGHVKVIPSPNATVYEMAGWCLAAANKLTK